MSLFRSPAKINIFLRVLAKRSDGYHELASLFQAIDLFDDLHIDKSNADQFTCTDPGLPTDASNLVVKAVDLFRRKTGITTPLRIHLEKRIPSEAGLGGGSSNAATTLWAMNELFQCPASLDQLKSWSAEIGSDITFFLSHGTAYCTGRGEILREQASLPSENLWIVKPALSLKTPLVFKSLCLKTISREDPEVLLKQCIAGNPSYVNDLEAPAFQLLPALASLKELLQQRGKVCMSGSGTSFFLIGKEPVDLGVGLSVFRASFVNRPKGCWY